MFAERRFASQTFCTPIKHGKQACLSSLRLNVPLLNMPKGMFGHIIPPDLIAPMERAKGHVRVHNVFQSETCFISASELCSY